MILLWCDLWFIIILVYFSHFQCGHAAIGAYKQILKTNPEVRNIHSLSLSLSLPPSLPLTLSLSHTTDETSVLPEGIYTYIYNRRA